MSSDDLVEEGKAAIVGELVKEVSESPKIREAGSQLAVAALTVAKAINVCLLPLAAVNFGYEKARQYFQDNFVIDLERKTAEIPVENLVEPKPSVAGPALQGLAFAVDEPSLKEMYLNLIATAMDGRVAGKAHPSFVEIIRQINSDEANLLPFYLQTDQYSPVVEVRLISPGGDSWLVIMPHLIRFENLKNGLALEDEAMSAKIDNMVRLGLITVSYVTEVKVEKAYDWVEERPEIVRYRRAFGIEGKTISWVRGTIGRTAFGAQFGKAVGII